jgi:hypothetical protein
MSARNLQFCMQFCGISQLKRTENDPPNEENHCTVTERTEQAVVLYRQDVNSQSAATLPHSSASTEQVHNIVQSHG